MVRIPFVEPDLPQRPSGGESASPAMMEVPRLAFLTAGLNIRRDPIRVRSGLRNGWESHMAGRGGRRDRSLIVQSTD